MNGSVRVSRSELNGVSDPAERPLRFVFVVESVVSEYGNPFARNVRALTEDVRLLGHDVVVLEERLNEPTRRLLQERGSGAIREFAAAYPDLQYRTFDLPSGRQRPVWLVQQTATADAIIVQDRATTGVIEALAGLEVRTLLRGYWSSDADGNAPDWADAHLAAGETASELLEKTRAFRRRYLPIGK